MLGDLQSRHRLVLEEVQIDFLKLKLRPKGDGSKGRAWALVSDVLGSKLTLSRFFFLCLLSQLDISFLNENK